MKYNPLPTLVIRNPFSDSPAIESKYKKTLAFLKNASVVLAILFITTFSYYLNMRYEEQTILKQKIDYEYKKAANAQPTIVLTTFTDIIVRVGRLPVDVAQQYAIWIFDAASKYAVDPVLMLSVITVESRFDYKAVSPTGPIGLFQVASTHHPEKTTKSALFDPRNNIFVGAQILKEYSGRSSNDVEMLLRYNGSLGEGSGYAAKVLYNKHNYETEILKAFIKS